MKTALMLISLIALAGLAGLMSTGCLVGSGPVVEQNYTFSNFSEIDVSHDFQYEITRGDTFSVKTAIHENLVDKLDVTTSGQTLIVKLKPITVTNTAAKLTVTMPELNRLDVSGASRGNVSGFKSTHSFDLHVSGAGQATLNMEAGQTKIDISGASKANGTLKAADLKLTVTGASHCELSGSAGAARIEVSGASNANIPDLVLQSADIELSGASSATIKTSGKLDLAVSGASTLNYYGNPTMGKMDISGASKIHSK